MTIETIVYKTNQTTIPSFLRKKYNISPNDIVEWNEEDGTIIVSFRKKVKVDDICGFIDLEHETNALDLEKELYEK